MHNAPECLNKRYLALDALIEDISRQREQITRQELSPSESRASVVSEDPAIRLMCHFWNILKEEPECDLTSAVQQSMCPAETHSTFSTDYAVYMADKSDDKMLGRCPKDTPCPSDCKGSRKDKDCKGPKTSSGGGINIKSNESTRDASPGCSGSRRPPHEGGSKRSALRDGSPGSDKKDQNRSSKDSTRSSKHLSRIISQKENSGSRTSPSRVTPKDQDSGSRTRSPEKAPTISTFTAPSLHSPSSPPLSKVLSDLHEASAYDKKCSEKLKELLTTENQLQETIQALETKEKKAIELLKKADCMWTCMEEQYKKKLQESEERQKHLMAELEEVDKSLMKWRKNAQDLAFQVENFEKYEKDISTRKNQKENDRKAMEQEIESLHKRIENDKTETETVLKSLAPRQKATEETVINLNKEISSLEGEIFQEQLLKQSKEREGQKGIKEARDNLTEICKRLLRKKIENEDLMAERAALVDEIELLTQCRDSCKAKCDQRVLEINDEIGKVVQEITEYQAKCSRCNHGTDSGDIQRFCSDCPRCLEQRQCLVEGDTCTINHAMDCICMTVKQTFVDNIFENIYSVLAKQANTPHGKSVAAAILACLRRSRNGKLDFETRNVIRGFVLDSIRTNLAMTIVGGAVKTRCEMEPDTYEQLMLCLKDVKSMDAPAQSKVDIGTFAKKDPCVRWAKSKECNCPGGPDGCICKKLMPDLHEDDTAQYGPPCPCPKEGDPPILEKTCPHKDTVCDAVCSHYTEDDISCLDSSSRRCSSNATRLNSVDTRILDEDDTMLKGSRRPSALSKKERKPKNNMTAHMMYGGRTRMESRGTPALVSPDPCFEKVVCKCGTRPQKECCCCQGRKDRKKSHAVVVNDVYEEVYGMPALDSVSYTTMDEGTLR